MKLRQVTQYDPPAYATREGLLAEDDLLGRHVPRRWTRKKGLAAVLATVFAAPVAGCGNPDVAPNAPPPPPQPMVEQAGEWIRSLMAPTPGPPPPQPPMLMGEVVLPMVIPPEDEVPSIFDEYPELRGKEG